MKEKIDYLSEADSSKHWANRISPAKYYSQVIERAIGPLEGKTLLDVGCAEGIEVAGFRNKGLLADGVDIKDSFVAIAAQRNPEAKFFVGSFENLPVSDGLYDILFSINTLFYTDIETSIPEMLRVIKKNGIAVFSYDIAIYNFDEEVLFHQETIEHLERVLANAGGRIVELSEEKKRLDSQPFKHEHTYYDVVARWRE